MRITPSKAQTDYLASVGAFPPSQSSEPLPSNSPAPQVPAVQSGPRRRPVPTSFSPAVWIVLVLIALLLVLAAVCRGEDLQGRAATNIVVTISNSPSIRPAGKAESAWASAPGPTGGILEERVSETNRRSMRPATGAAALTPKVTALSGRAVGVEETPHEKERSSTYRFADPPSLSQKYQRLAERLDRLDQAFQQRELAQDRAIRQLDAQLRLARASDLAWRDAFRATRQTITRQTLGFSVAASLLLALVLIGRRKVLEIEEKMALCATARRPTDAHVGHRFGPLSHIYSPRAIEGRKEPTKIAVAASRAPEVVPMGSSELQQELVAGAATVFKSLKVMPSMPTLPWQLGVDTLKGNVRPENQDVGVAFSVGECDALIVADGCGGIPHGREAAYLATVGAAMRLIQVLGTPSPSWKFPDLEEAIRSAIWAAHYQLANQADDFNIASGDINGGLRTTLIAVVGLEDRLCVGHIGDGGGYLVRTDGRVEKFLAPQKSSDSLNVLEASLGPLMAGSPIIKTLERRPGDLALVGTDGIFDRIPAKDIEVFGKDVLRACIEYEGDLQAVATQICAEYVAIKDDAGWVCDDNVTCALLGTRTRPVLGPGFWKNSAPTPESSQTAKKGNHEEKISEDRPRAASPLGQS